MRLLRALPIILALSLSSTRPAAFQQQPLSDQQIFDKFVEWVMKLPPEAHAHPDQVEADYRRLLAGEGLSPSEIDRHLRVIDQQAQKNEAETWNRVLTAPTPSFNTRPNAFLVDMTHGHAPGRALDVGMGQGRNAIYLAQQGWTVTGFDPADRAVAAAQAEARRLGVPLTALVERDDQFDFGNSKWDLIVLSYVRVREIAGKVTDALAPGGIVVVEAFQRDAAKATRIGADVVFDSNELLSLFDRLRVIRYEDTDGTGDFGLQKVRLVRLCAQKR